MKPNMSHGRPLVPSMNFSSAYSFSGIDDLVGYHSDKHNSVRYGRDSNEISLSLEGSIGQYCGGYPALLTSSGMSAIVLAVEAIVSCRNRIVSFGSFYRKTLSFFRSLSKKYGVEHSNFDGLEDYIKLGDPKSSDVIFVETPSNPFLRLCDIGKLRAANPKAKIITDATFQGLGNDKGMLAHSDIILHSCTKYISGHNDLICGLVLFPNEELYDAVWDERSMRGGLIDNTSAYLLHRSFQTYDLRIKAAIDNAAKVLDFLHLSDSVDSIYYPGSFENSDQEELFINSHEHGGVVVTFKVRPEVDIRSSIAKMKTFKMAPSFGSVGSLIEVPAYMSHYGKTDIQLEELGLTKLHVRASIGVEDFSQIKEDLQVLLQVV